MSKKLTAPRKKITPEEKIPTKTAGTVKKKRNQGTDAQLPPKSLNVSLDVDAEDDRRQDNGRSQARDSTASGLESNPEMPPNKSQIVNMRVPIQIVQDIDYWVSNRRYRSRSEFVLAAVRYYLDYIEYRESYNTRTFQRGQNEETPAERIDRLRYLRGPP
jgi:Arc/MetJ-type ribon-helix-helix transcriptional regulator